MSERKAALDLAPEPQNGTPPRKQKPERLGSVASELPGCQCHHQPPRLCLSCCGRVQVAQIPPLPPGSAPQPQPLGMALPLVSGDRPTHVASTHTACTWRCCAGAGLGPHAGQ